MYVHHIIVNTAWVYIVQNPVYIILIIMDHHEMQETFIETIIQFLMETIDNSYSHPDP